MLPLPQDREEVGRLEFVRQAVKVVLERWLLSGYREGKDKRYHLAIIAHRLRYFFSLGARTYNVYLLDAISAGVSDS